ncbi:30S ribosomal protein S6 [Pseudobythopirellula maris]|uniref:Small ribosomal subunit protein bS6 n=1 Tax=Pseudobythopirellula maris TaxID=2527991 RepID=A0A5C5ZMT2_9BACT|nr:30S ribosomal protein S6 [Pseudobythopirellula maris]TWT88406.1 30S ribosomal protein S6 [Pseudobythopirellula maris]
MSLNTYEGLFILDSNKFARDHDALPEAISKLIADAGGEVVVSRLWEERRLAYPVKGHRKGSYWLMYFKLAGPEVVGFNRQCELMDGLLRHLVLKIHPRLVEPILAHATGATEAEEPAADEAPAEEAQTASV